MKKNIVRIGCATGGETDGILGMEQLLALGEVDYVFLDALAEPSMAPLGRLAAGNANGGFNADFAAAHLTPHLAALKARGIRLITNAGGMNPRALAAHLQAAAAGAGVSIRVAAVVGDNLLHLAERFREQGTRDMFTGRPFPDNVTSVNAYLGGFPIAAALAQGADVVITGRAVDSGLALGALIHEFGWKPEDLDLLAAGTVAGHLLECGAQVCGGIFTDWRDVPGWDNPGYPIGECHADGTVVITKAPGSGGLVSVGTVSEQLLYEVGDPRAYIVPDVVCDLSEVRLRQDGADRVHVSGARGYAPTTSYKALVTWNDGWRATALSPIIGMDAVEKARRRNDALIALTRRLLRERGLPDWQRVHSEVLGAEDSYGARARAGSSREVIAKLVVEHQDRAAVEMFGREERGSQMNMVVGTASGLGAYLAAPTAVPVSRLFSFLVEKRQAPVTIHIDGADLPFEVAPGSASRAAVAPRPAPNEKLPPCDGQVPLVQLAWGRSGDKGNLFNVAVIARAAEYLPYIRQALTPAAVRDWFGHCFAPEGERRVDRHEAPGFSALNFVVHEALGGGVASGSPMTDRSAKGMSQQLLEFTVPVPAAIAAKARENAR